MSRPCDADHFRLPKEPDMLVLTRKVGESILIPSQGLTIQIGPVKRGRVRLRITAPAETRIVREEVRDQEKSSAGVVSAKNDLDRLPD